MVGPPICPRHRPAPQRIIRESMRDDRCHDIPVGRVTRVGQTERSSCHRRRVLLLISRRAGSVGDSRGCDSHFGNVALDRGCRGAARWMEAPDERERDLGDLAPATVDALRRLDGRR